MSRTSGESENRGRNPFCVCLLRPRPGRCRLAAGQMPALLFRGLAGCWKANNYATALRLMLTARRYCWGSRHVCVWRLPTEPWPSGHGPGAGKMFGVELCFAPAGADSGGGST